MNGCFALLDAATAAAFTDGWLNTGDVVELDAATGQVQVIDRNPRLKPRGW